MLRKLLLSVLAVVVPLTSIVAPNTANAATAATCTDGIAVTQFSFSPPVVSTTGSSTLTLVLQNCGTQTVSGSTFQSGQYTGQNCPVLDPGPPADFTIAVGGTFSLLTTYGAPGGLCQPSSLMIHAQINENGVAGAVITTTATLQFVPPCTTNGIAVDQFSFSPTTVAPTQYSTLTLVLQNCTGQAAQGSSDWYPQFTWSGTGMPPGCPVMDPISFTYSMAPGATSTATLGLDDPVTSCLATGIKTTANVYENGITMPAATATANLVITQPAPNGCHVTYTPNDWQNGFTANVTVANNGSSAINGWTLTFAFPGDQTITSVWNAAITQTPTGVTAANLSYNAAIPPGGSQSFGFQGTWTANDASPTSFSVNGAPCT